jgi:hypothetical protein
MSSTTTSGDNQKKPKQQQRSSLTMDQCYESLVKLRPDATFTTGAVKALAMIHTSFLQVTGAELARQEEDVTRLKEPHVEQALKLVGFGELCGKAKVVLANTMTNNNNTTNNSKKTKSTKRKRGAVTAEMQAAQERLLAASKQNMMDKQQQQQQQT